MLSRREMLDSTDKIARQVGVAFSMADLKPDHPRKMLVMVAYGDVADTLYPLVKALDDLLAGKKPK